MNGERNFSAVNTKVRVLKSRLLSNKDYVNLIQEKSIKEQIDYLKDRTVYGNVLKDIEEFPDIQKIEIELKKYLIIQLEKIIRYFSQEYKDFYKAMLLRYEIENLKLYLRSIERNDKLPDVACFFSKYITFNCKNIKNTTDISEFVENLKGTIYYDVLMPYKDADDSRILFYMEMNLDRLYFSEIKAKSEKLNKFDRIAIEDLLGENIDLLNIEWIYRGIKFYNLFPEELINYLLPYGKEFKYKELKRMCYSDIDELKDIILNSRYSFLFDTQKDVDLYMERRIERYLYYKFKETFKKGNLSVLIPIAYIHLLEFEIRDIISILEAKRYGLTLQETTDYLVKKIEGSDWYGCWKDGNDECYWRYSSCR